MTDRSFDHAMNLYVGRLIVKRRALISYPRTIFVSEGAPSPCSNFSDSGSLRGRISCCFGRNAVWTANGTEFWSCCMFRSPSRHPPMPSSTYPSTKASRRGTGGKSGLALPNAISLSRSMRFGNLWVFGEWSDDGSHVLYSRRSLDMAKTSSLIVL